MKVKDLIKYLEVQYAPGQEIACMLWTTEDLDMLSNADDLSDLEKSEVIRRADDMGSGEDGITWSTIEQAIHEVKMLRTQVEI
jgi:hypothetical protein